MAVSQRLLREAYPAIFDDMRSSGNRKFNPIQRCSPFINSPLDYEYFAWASELLRSTLQNKLCLSPLCPDFGHDGMVLDSLLKELQDIVREGDPIEVQSGIQQTLEFLEAFSLLTESRRMNDASCPRYPSSQNRSGLGPGVQLMMRDVGLRLMPSVVAGGVGAVYQHISIMDRLMGNNTGGVRRLVEDLRVDEQEDLLVYLQPAASDGQFLASKIVKIIQGEPADAEEMMAELRQLHQMRGF